MSGGTASCSPSSLATPTELWLQAFSVTQATMIKKRFYFQFSDIFVALLLAFSSHNKCILGRQEEESPGKSCNAFVQKKAAVVKAEFVVIAIIFIDVVW